MVGICADLNPPVNGEVNRTHVVPHFPLLIPCYGPFSVEFLEGNVPFSIGTLREPNQHHNCRPRSFTLNFYQINNLNSNNSESRWTCMTGSSSHSNNTLVNYTTVSGMSYGKLMYPFNVVKVDGCLYVKYNKSHHIPHQATSPLANSFTISNSANNGLNDVDESRNFTNSSPFDFKSWVISLLDVAEEQLICKQVMMLIHKYEPELESLIRGFTLMGFEKVIPRQIGDFSQEHVALGIEL